MMDRRVPFQPRTTNATGRERENWRPAGGIARGYSNSASFESRRGRKFSPQRLQSEVVEVRSGFPQFVQASNSSRPNTGQGSSSQRLQSQVRQVHNGDSQNQTLNSSRPNNGRSSSSTFENRQNRSHPGGQRIYPIGVKVMQSLLEKEPYMIPVELLKKNSGYEILLNDIDLREFKVGLIIQLLEKSVVSKANDEGVIDLLIITFRNTNFCQKLMAFISEIKFEIKNAKYLELIGSIISEFLRLSPANAYPLIANLVDVCTGVIMHLRSEDPMLASGLQQMFENIQLQIKESRTKHLAQKAGSTKNIAPPDNFRDLEVIPTCAELNAFNRPFLRENVINGKYENSNHYLDVQFRLLKEDFVRPLREGLQDYRKTNQKRNSDVRIYTDVTLDSSAVDKNEYIHYLKLSLRSKTFQIEKSRRLMFGNILCISYDNFETMITASIANRDKLKDHLIAIKIETEPFKLEQQRMYTVIESKAYFVTYKHTLSALQSIVEVPLKEYVVHVNETEAPPDYLQRFSTYDIKIGVNLISTVTLLDPIEYWPSSRELKMDESQRRALHGALTRQLAIIQGPPGTGKTFLGLQVTKILLNNKDVWNPGKRNPILVVCYTNHALDQFLEGMLGFTENLIRVGSQSKNETLAHYQINKRINSFKGEEDNHIWRRYYELREEIRGLQCIMDSIAKTMKKINNPGIIHLSSFTREFPSIIPARLQQHINRFTMRGFLSQYTTDSQNDDNIIEPMYMTQNDSSVVIDNETDEEFYDVDEEILQEEEQNRIIEDIDDESISEVELRKIQVPYFVFDITLPDIVAKIVECDVLIKENPFDRKTRVYAEQVQILGLLSRAIVAGQKIEFSVDECKQIEKNPNIDGISFIQRWKLYNYWKSELCKKYSKRLSHLEQMHMKLNKSMVTVKDLRNLSFMKTADIVGMTTTGAGQYCKILHDLAPSIVIVEEAAEIMEAHLVTSLSSKCKHLIIIGDHQQLRPKPNVYELGLKYHLDTSFFERMIKNGITYETLEFQHRMKPMISNLLVPTIYEDLKDHPSVFKYPKIKGIQKDMFFLDHNVYEDHPLEEAESFENTYEAEFLMGLCRHLLYQGYKSEDVTIITPYLGQHRCLKQLQKRGEFSSCSDVRISVLDNYQGEESNIILLSLVRSNEESKVGFVKIDNRVCVALSRAKHGMYIIGNMSQMSEASNLWMKIRKKLIDGGNIGPELHLECQNHPEQIMKVKSLRDMLLTSPEGGCKLPCSAYLPRCNHKCPRLCHIADQDHTRVNCTRPCPKTICNLGHACPKLCFQECEKCVVLIKKFLPCGHEHPVQCSVKPEDFKCPTIVNRELPYCKHLEDMECHIDVKKYKCTRNCVVRLDCGHQCKNKCHPLKDPNHESYDCHVPCDKKPLNCEFNHKCKKKCFEDCGTCNEIITRHMKCGHTLHRVKCGTLEKDIKCPQKCNRMLPACGHKCPKTCGEECGGCTENVDKVVPDCGHRIKFHCSKTPTLRDCGGKCGKLLACQHRFTNLCKEICTSRCLQTVDTNYKCPKGHKVKLPCYLSQQKENAFSIHSTSWKGKTVGEFCTEQCGMALECGHLCKGKCGDCLNGRLHATCREKCDRTLVCGHVCKEPCSTACPPCQSKCLWKCSHSRCTKPCGLPCINCQEQCGRQCPHSLSSDNGCCKGKCGEKCTIEPCSQPCPKKLQKCDHDCIGYCGEPCPKQCRICDKEEVTEIFFGPEDEDDARFVLLEDCGHIFEGESLDEWMKVSEDGKVEISMKSCPRCKTPIYSTQRYKNQILSAYNYVRKVKKKHFTSKRTVDKNQLKKTLRDLVNVWFGEISLLRENLGFDDNFYPKRKQKPISDQQMLLYEFQLYFLSSAEKTLKNVGGETAKLRELINSLMKYTLTISQQTMDEYSCELRRLDICVPVEKLRERVKPLNITSILLGSSPINRIVAKIDSIMDPTIKFDAESEKKVIECLKEAEKYMGPLGITDSERLQILGAMGLSQGHWYACPNGHVYCITECGGATVESVCPECKAPIGGSEHRLRGDNRVATEMDGAIRSAWPGGP